MNPHCDPIRELIAAECGEERPWNVSLEEHLQGCGECASLARRLQRCLHHVGDLPSEEAPAELEGLVVAACHAGFREGRAAGELLELGAVTAPSALDDRIGVLFEEMRDEGLLGGRDAPSALHERVDQDLADLPQTTTRRLLEKLTRLTAPAELNARVEDELRAPTLRWRPRPASVLVASLTAAAGLLILSGSPWWPGSDAPLPLETLEPVPLSFKVEYPTDLESLSPRAREMAARLSGGLELTPETLARVPVESVVLGAASLAPRRAAVGSSAGTGSNLNSTSGSGSSSMGSTGAASSPGQAPGGGAGPTYFAGIASAQELVAYRGMREVAQRTSTTSMIYEVVYQEEVASDGAGKFAVVPRQVISPVMGWGEEALFLSRQESRQGFFYKHRDFLVRGSTAFWQNYEVEDLAQEQVIAGRTCETLRIKRSDGTGNIYIVAIDPLTSLVMKEDCTKQTGELISRTEFQTFELGADLSDLQLSDGVDPWTEVTVAALEPLLTEAPLVPVAPPIGYELLRVGHRANPVTAGSVWVQQVYGDGVEQVFFLFEDSLTGPGNSSSSSGLGQPVADVIRVYSTGPWSILEGRVQGRYVMSVGRVSSGELLLMLQSAL